jgi:regulator of protease activity HflC (stomatin/prohibitin superfamily)
MGTMGIIVIALVAVIYLLLSVRVVKQYQQGVHFRLGKIRLVKNPGLTMIIPWLDRLKKIDMRTITHNVPGQDVITKDNISVRVSAVLYYKVVDPIKAIIEIEDYADGTSQLAQTTLRSICGMEDMDHMLSERDAINHKMQEILDHETHPWGIKVSKVEIKEIDLPDSMQRAMARQAEAERERRASIINADGELQAATKLSEAAELISKNPAAIQLRYLQTIREIGVSDKTTTLIPIPVDLIKGIFSKNS